MTMTVQMPNKNYMEEDINEAYNRGALTALSIFEMTLGMSEDNQRYILSSIKEMLIEDKAAG
jgi:hypothetical protein